MDQSPSSLYNEGSFRIEFIVRVFVSARKGQHGAERRGWHLDAETAVLSFLMES